MKFTKIYSIALSAMLAAQVSCYDVDKNGTVNTIDALHVLKQVVGLENNAEYNYDVDGDGNVASSDALEVLKYVVGITSDSTPTDTDNSTINSIADSSSNNSVSSSISDSSVLDSSISDSSISDSSSTEEIDFSIKEKFYDGSYEQSEATVINLTGSTADINGSGAECSNGTLNITEKGTYILSGEFDGNICVETDDKKVQLVLNGVTVNSKDYSAVHVKNSDKVTLTLEKGTTNTFTDTENYTTEDNNDACIFSKADLIINGEGNLIVNGNYKHGIVSKDDVIITSGNVEVKSVSGGIYGKDSVKIGGGTVNVTAGTNGIKATNEENALKGYVSIIDGNIKINAQNDAIEAENQINISGGDIDIVSGGGYTNGTAKNDWGNPWGGSWGNTTTTTTTDETSTKGIKSTNLLSISGGNITINSADDCIHSNSDIKISGGKITASSGDDGVHADNILDISGGEISIENSYEGLEGTHVYIRDGEISVVASDDGINAAGGSDQGFGGMPGMQRPGMNNDNSMPIPPDFSGSMPTPPDFSGTDSIPTPPDFSGTDSTADNINNTSTAVTNPLIEISGGYIVVNADGDGLDSNGNLVVSGGEIYVYGPTNSGNGALDSDGSITITGGIIAAFGATGMDETFGSASTQCNVRYVGGSTVAGGTKFEVKDSSGNVIISCTPEKNYQSVVFSSPLLKQGETYTITEDSTDTQITISSICTSNGSTGGGMGGGNRPWGRQTQTKGVMMTGGKSNGTASI